MSKQSVQTYAEKPTSLKNLNINVGPLIIGPGKNKLKKDFDP